MTNVHQIHPKPLGAKQREALMLAEHGDIGLVKGITQQRKALVRKGMLTHEHELTDLGHSQLRYEHLMQEPMQFFELASLLGASFHKQAHVAGPAGSMGYGSPNWIGTVSSDGRTGYVVRRSYSASGIVHAVLMATVPTEFVSFFTGRTF